MLAAGVILTALTLLFAPFLVRAFGIDTEPLLSEGVTALRIVSATLPLHAIQVLFFIYYYLLDRQALAFFVGLLKNLISPVVMAVRMILRDSGILFDVTDADSLPVSLRQYVVARMMVVHDKKAYLTTTGYNRIELFSAKMTTVETVVQLSKGNISSQNVKNVAGPLQWTMVRYFK